MSNLNNDIQKINQQFKNGVLKNLILNLAILILTMVFFSIFAQVSGNLFLDFLHLKWSVLFPSILDLLSLGVAIFYLNKIKNEYPSFIFIPNENNNDEENNKQIINFINKDNNLNGYFFILIAVSILNYLFNILFNQINNVLSPLNEWYYTSGLFYSLPIFPINIVLILISFALIGSLIFHIYEYKKQLGNLLPENMKYNTKPNFEAQANFKFIFTIFQLGFIVICVFLSLLKFQTNLSLFAYFNPQYSCSTLACIFQVIENKKIDHVSSAIFSINRNKAELTIQETEYYTAPFSGERRENTREISIFTTPELANIYTNNQKQKNR